jgi:hypothetical protein
MIHADGFSFSNTREGFDGLLSEIRKAQPRHLATAVLSSL